MNSVVGRAFGALLCVFFALVPGSAHAQRLRFGWRAPDTCPSEEAVRGEVARLLGGTIPEQGTPISAEASAIEGETGDFELTLRTDVDGARGERTLSAERCEELAAAAALIVALMIDPEAVARIDPSQPSPLVAAPSAPPDAARSLGPPSIVLSAPPRRSPAPIEEAPSTPAEPTEPIRVLAGIGGVLDLGTLPSVTGGVLVEVGFGIALIDGRLRATLLFPQIAGNQALPGATAELWSLNVGVLGCLHPIDVFRALGICADVEGGSVFGQSAGITDPRAGGAFWLAAGGGLTLAWQPEPWFDLEVMAEALGQIVASEFVVTLIRSGATTEVVLFHPPGITGRFGLTAHVHF